MDTNLYQLKVMCPESYLRNLSTVLSDCADLTLEGDEDDDIIGATKPLFMAVQNLTLTDFIHQLIFKKITFNVMTRSLREVVTLVSSSDSVLFLKQLKKIVGNDTAELSNMTLSKVYEVGKAKFNLGNGTSSEVWANYSPPQTMNLREVSDALMMSLEETLLLSLGRTLKLLKAVNGSKAYLPFLYATKICNRTTNATQTPLHSFANCIGDTSDLEMNGFSRVKFFSFDTIKSLSIGQVSSDVLEHADVFGLVYIGNQGIDALYQLSTQPLILLARGNGISLQGLQENTLIATLMRIFKVDENILRILFVVDDETYALLRTNPLKSVTALDDGLQNVQELYTGSLQTMISAVTSGRTSTFAIEKHLPRYVSLLSSKNFSELSYLYETNLTALMEIDLVEIVHRFFGIIQPPLFKTTFQLDDINYGQLKRSRLSDVLSLGTKYATTSQGLDRNTLNITLNELIDFVTSIDRQKFDFFVSPLRNQTQKNNTIAEFTSFNASYRSLIIEQVKGLVKEDLRELVVDYLLQTNLTELAINIGKNESGILDMNVIEVVPVFLRCKRSFLPFYFILTNPVGKIAKKTA